MYEHTVAQRLCQGIAIVIATWGNTLYRASAEVVASWNCAIASTSFETLGSAFRYL